MPQPGLAEPVDAKSKVAILGGYSRDFVHQQRMMNQLLTMVLLPLGRQIESYLGTPAKYLDDDKLEWEAERLGLSPRESESIKKVLQEGGYTHVILADIKEITKETGLLEVRVVPAPGAKRFQPELVMSRSTSDKMNNNEARSISDALLLDIVAKLGRPDFRYAYIDCIAPLSNSFEEQQLSRDFTVKISENIHHLLNYIPMPRDSAYNWDVTPHHVKCSTTTPHAAKDAHVKVTGRVVLQNEGTNIVRLQLLLEVTRQKPTQSGTKTVRIDEKFDFKEWEWQQKSKVFQYPLGTEFLKRFEATWKDQIENQK